MISEVWIVVLFDALGANFLKAFPNSALALVREREIAKSPWSENDDVTNRWHHFENITECLASISGGIVEATVWDSGFIRNGSDVTPAQLEEEPRCYFILGPL